MVSSLIKDKEIQGPKEPSPVECNNYYWTVKKLEKWLPSHLPLF